LFVKKKTYGGWKESGERSPLAAQTELVLCKSVIEWDVEYLVTEVDCSRIQVGERIDNMRDTWYPWEWDSN
jgi:hypothetical protein